MEYLEILIKLRKIMRSVNLESKKIEKELGVSIPQLLVLQYLSTQQQLRASAKDIKLHINLSASTVSGIIDRLELKGLVARLPNPEDRRASYISLTTTGNSLLKDSPMTMQEKVIKKLRLLPPGEMVNMSKYIDLLIDIMDVRDLDAAPLLTSEEL